MRGGGQRALPVVRYWLRVALDSSRPPVFENQPGERNEQAAFPDRRRDVYGRDRFRLRCAERRRARQRQEDGQDGQEVTCFDYRKGRACPCLFYFPCAAFLP